MCGEQHPRTGGYISPWGSPPRVRGTGRRSMNRGRISRITPACAGNRCTFETLRDLGKDHPRVCGEQSAQERITERGEGSPPRVRGTGSLGLSSATGFRITPACAGNRGCRFPPGRFEWDHPRVCGEQPFQDQPSRYVPGSPPRVRGTVQRSKALILRQWITPACAGNSGYHPVQDIPGGDHPRVCGEQISLVKVVCGLLGSPPRVRGTACENAIISR